jgi:hypothetical protein
MGTTAMRTFAGGKGTVRSSTVGTGGMKNKRKRKTRLVREAAKREADALIRKREEREDPLSDWDGGYQG